MVCFSLGIIVYSVLEVVARGFYADKDTMFPLLAGVVGAAVNLVLSYVLSGALTLDDPSTAFPGGLALANSLGVAVEVVLLTIVLRHRCDGRRHHRR